MMSVTSVRSLTTGLVLSVTLQVLASPLVAAPQEGGDAPPAETREVERPRFTFLRQNEDWSSLADFSPEELTDPWDRIKYVPLSEDGSIWASFGGSTRLRVESWNNFGFGSPPNDNDTFALWRALFHGDFHFGENLRVFAQGKSAFASDRDLPGGRRPLDVDSIDLEQAFADVVIPLGEDASLTLRPGRQAYSFGKQRLVSPLPWSNTLRRWDGITGIFSVGGWKIDSFWSQFVPVKKYEFNTADAQTQFFGVYATGSLGEGAPGLDLYWLGLDKDDDVTFNGTTGPEERFTMGGRLFGNFGESGFDYDLEGAYQWGEVGRGDVDAFMIGSQLGFKAAELWGSPRFFVGFDYASGDDEPGGDVETFNQLFPLGHAYYGFIDAIGRQNAIDFNLGATCTPMPKMTLYAAGHFFWRASTDDALYNAGGMVSRAGAMASDREIGQEINVVLKYKFNRHLLGELGYGYFFAGDFIEETGASDDIQFLWASLEYTF
jgi:hypothetical protein